MIELANVGRKSIEVYAKGQMVQKQRRFTLKSVAQMRMAQGYNIYVLRITCYVMHDQYMYVHDQFYYE